MKLKAPRSVGSSVYLVLLVGVAIGLLLVALGYWRTGVAGIGFTFGVGTLVRAVTSDAHKGMLGVRGRAFDVVWMALLAIGLFSLALLVPNVVAAT